MSEQTTQKEDTRFIKYRLINDVWKDTHEYEINLLEPDMIGKLLPDFAIFAKHGLGDLAKALISNTQFQFISSGKAMDLDVDLSKLMEAIGGFGDALVEIQERRERRKAKTSFRDDLLTGVLRDGKPVLAHNHYNEFYKGNLSEIVLVMYAIIEANSKDSILDLVQGITIPFEELAQSAISSVIEKVMAIAQG